MPRIQFELNLDSDDTEPSRFLITFSGTIYQRLEPNDENDDEENEEIVGHVELILVRREQIWNEHESLFEAMDSLSSETCECYESIFDVRTGDWKQAILSLYKPEEPMHPDLLFIQKLELQPEWRGKGIGSDVVEQIVFAMGSMCGLVCCKPFPIEYTGWQEPYKNGAVESPEDRSKRLKMFRRVRSFWLSQGFLKVRGTEFVVFSPELNIHAKKSHEAEES